MTMQSKQRISTKATACSGHSKSNVFIGNDMTIGDLAGDSGASGVKVAMISMAGGASDLGGSGAVF